MSDTDILDQLDKGLDQYVRCDQTGCRRVATTQMVYTCMGPGNVYCCIHGKVVADLLEHYAELEAEWSCPEHCVSHGILEAVHMEELGC